MPPFHDPLNIGLFKENYKPHVHLKAHVTLMKPVVPKMPRKVGNRSHSCSHIKKRKEKGEGEKKKSEGRKNGEYE